jgi:DNA-binding MarR family transcriptional regulator
MSAPSHPKTDKLLELSEDVNRIAATLAQLSASHPKMNARPQGSPEAENARIPVDVVRSAIPARRLRTTFFEEDLFADPAWDMLLFLFEAEIAQFRVTVSSLCAAAAVPPTTALRWLKNMTDKGIFLRRADPHDARRVFVELSPDASARMRRYFSAAAAASMAQAA